MIEEDCPDQLEDLIPIIEVGTIKTKGAFLSFSHFTSPTNSDPETKVGSSLSDNS